MVDSNKQSLADFVFASRTEIFASGKRRHVTDAFRTVCWFNGVRIATGVKFPSHLDLPLAQTDTRSINEPVNRQRKWQGYRLGRHTPSSALVDEVDAQLRGSAYLLNHPAWCALRCDNHTMRQVRVLLAQLQPNILASLRTNTRATIDYRSMLEGWSKRRLRKLERQVSLDTLAALVLLLRLAAGANKPELAFEFGVSVCRMLLMMGPWLTERCIARPLSEYLAEHVLPLSHKNGVHPCFGQEDFVDAARRLALTAWFVEGNENKRLSGQDRADLLLDLLDDKFSRPFSDLVSTRPNLLHPEAALNNSRHSVS